MANLLPGVDQRQGFFVQRVVGRGQDPPARMHRQRVAGPVGYDTAGLFDDGRHRQVIVWLQSGLDDQVDMPRRQQSVVVAVAAEPAQVYGPAKPLERSEEHTSELQSLMRISYAVLCLKKKKTKKKYN